MSFVGCLLSKLSTFRIFVLALIDSETDTFLILTLVLPLPLLLLLSSYSSLSPLFSCACIEDNALSKHGDISAFVTMWMAFKYCIDIAFRGS